MADCFDCGASLFMDSACPACGSKNVGDANAALRTSAQVRVGRLPAVRHPFRRAARSRRRGLRRATANGAKLRGPRSRHADERERAYEH